MDSFFWLALETTQLQKNETCTREGIHDGQAQNASVFTTILLADVMGI